MNYELFKYEIFKLTGIDLNLYKENQMKRRIENYIKRHRYEGYEQFARMLNRDPKLRSRFLDYITINVTRFFRTPEHWQTLEEQIIPQLPHPHAWSMACSTGEEAYTVAMSLAQHFPLDKIKVLATDIDEHVLEKAAKGLYTKEEMEDVPPEYRDKYFIQIGRGYYVRDELRRCVEFRRMNLLSDDFPRDMDLIICRNVLIYFTSEAKQQLYGKIRNSLTPGGTLFTGEAEQIVFYKHFGLNRISKYLYSRPRQYLQKQRSID